MHYITILYIKLIHYDIYYVNKVFIVCFNNDGNSLSFTYLVTMYNIRTIAVII